MLKRTITALVLIGILLPIILIDKLLYAFYAFFGICALLGSFEVLNLAKKNQTYQKIDYILVLLATLSFYVFGILALEINPILILIGVILALLLPTLALIFDKNLKPKNLIHMYLSICYPGIGFLAISVLRHYDFRLVVYLFAISLVTDTFALFYGLLFGKHLLAPKVSPKKTWEGAIGGSIIGMLVSGTFAFMYGELFLNYQQTIFGSYKLFANMSYIGQAILIFVISLLLTFVSQSGDLLASKLKRTYDVKDYSQILPGHGGIMDRFDSVVLTAFVLSLFVIIL